MITDAPVSFVWYKCFEALVTYISQQIRKGELLYLSWKRSMVIFQGMAVRRLWWAHM
jgi:hypothetical protein